MAANDEIPDPGRNDAPHRWEYSVRCTSPDNNVQVFLTHTVIKDRVVEGSGGGELLAQARDQYPDYRCTPVRRRVGPWEEVVEG